MQIGHSGFVVSVSPIPAGRSPLVPGTGLVSGSQDTTVHVWDVEECSIAQQLKGHNLQVNAVGVLPGGEIVSGGMDAQLKMWKGGKAVFSQKEHSAPILCICVLSSGEFLTGVKTGPYAPVSVDGLKSTNSDGLGVPHAGSGDKTIKKWSGNVVDATFTGHSDSVRALCEVPGKGFLSGSHDATLRLWNLAGHCSTVFTGHTSLVYTCAVSRSCIASGELWR